MKCPACSSLLTTIKTKSATVDFCPSCRGIWFDEGELSPFVRVLVQSHQISPEKVRFFHKRDVKRVTAGGEKEKLCPRCNLVMRRFNYSYDSNIFLDKCPDCGGIWTDSGEVRAIASYLKENPQATAIGRELAEITSTGEREEDVEEVAKKTVRFLLFFPRVIVPFGSDGVLQKFPVVTLSFMIFFILIFAVTTYFAPDSLAGTVRPILDNDIYGLDVVTSIFLIGTPLNLLWSVLFLWIFGGSIENRFGKGNFSLFFTAIAGFSVFPYILSVCDERAAAVATAGGVSAVIGAHLIFFPMSKIRTFVVYRVFEVPSFILIGLWFIILLASPFLKFVSAVPITAWLAPMLGFGGGLAISHYVKTAGAQDKYPF